MRLPLFLLLIALLAVPPHPVVAAAPKKCFTPPEIAAEREIRHGIYMREASRRCGEWMAGMFDRWEKFEEISGPKFKAANGKRIKAWQREFPDDWQYQMNWADGRLVTYARNVPRTKGYCENIDENLQELDKRGYAAFLVQSKTIHNEVIQAYKTCQ